jgi:hypothetical protein
MRQFCLWVAVSVGSSAAVAETPQVAEYRSRMNGYVFKCAQEFKVEQLKAKGIERYDLPEVPADSAKCIRESRDSGKALFDAALKAAKKPDAKSALKSVHVAYLASLEGIAPLPDERVGGYQQRQAVLATKLTEAWARFDVEQ